MALNYGWEKLFSACHYAVGSSATVQARLAAVVSSDLHLLRRDDLPSDETWGRVRKIMDATTCKPARGSEGTIAATTSQMSDDEASKLLSEIMSIFTEVAEEYGRLQSIRSAAAVS
jgi:hypothetical protein